MLSKATCQLIRSLDTRKGRRQTGLFVAEGPKLVSELLGHFRCEALFYTDSPAHSALLNAATALQPGLRATALSSAELQRASLQQSPQGVLALLRIPQDELPTAQVVASQLSLVLDGVQDPGNLGTIVRLADWFGVEHIFCSPDTCDVWNPKALQATMGGIARVRVHYLNISDWLCALPAAVPVYGTSLQGNTLWRADLTPQGVVVMGNEGRGVSAEVAALCRHQLLIPNFPEGRSSTDSLNVAMATAITLAEFRRRSSPTCNPSLP